MDKFKAIGDEEVIASVAEDRLDRNRSIFRKGRMEFMGGPVLYEQDGLNNQKRTFAKSTKTFFRDPIADELGVDAAEY